MSLPLSSAGLSATPGNGIIELAWGHSANDGGSPVTNWVVYRGTTALLLSQVAEVPATSPFTFYTDTGLTNGTTYYYRVAAVNAEGTGRPGPELWTEPVG